MDILELLLRIGLSDKEARVYIAVLELGRDTVQNIAKKAEVKRVTVYVILERLMQLGIVSTVSEKKKNYYIAEHPSELENVLNSQLQEIETRRAVLKNSLNELEAIYNFRKDKPSVRFFEGGDGLEALDRYGHDQFSNSKTAWALSPTDLIEEYFPRRRQEAVQERVSAGVKTKTIYVSKDPSTENKKDKTELREGVAFSREELPIEGSIIVYPNWGVKIFNFKKGSFFGVLIQSADVANTLDQLFSLAWKEAKQQKTGKR